MTDSQLKNSTLNKSTDSSKFKDIIKEIPKLKISENKTENKIEIIENNNNTNENENLTKEIKNIEKKDEEKKDEEKKVNKHFQRWDSSFMEKADPEKLRRKRLRDLFYKKINEKFDYLHRMFVKFYYKGLYFQMLHPQPQKKTNHSPKKSPRGVILNSNRNNTIENEEKVEEKKVEKVEEKKVEKIEKKIEKKEKKEEKKEEKKIEIEKPKKNIIKTEININQPQIEEKEDLRSKAKNLRKLIKNKNKHNKDTLKTYFYKFYMHGVICSIKREGRRLIRQKTEKGLKSKNEEKDDYHKKLNNFINHTSSKKAAEILKKKEQEETKLEHLLYIKQRKTFLVLKTILNKWNLTAKILKLSSGNNSTEIEKKRGGKRHKSTNPTKIKKKGISVSKKPKIKGNSLIKELPQTKIKAIENELNLNNNNVNINTLKNNKDDSNNIISGKKMEDYLKGFDILNRDNFKNRQSKSPNKRKFVSDINKLGRTYKKDDLLRMIHNMKEKKDEKKNNINLNMFTKYGNTKKLNDSQNQIGNNSHIK
jgi:hypothetical protein